MRNLLLWELLSPQNWPPKSALPSRGRTIHVAQAACVELCATCREVICQRRVNRASRNTSCYGKAEPYPLRKPHMPSYSQPPRGELSALRKQCMPKMRWHRRVKLSAPHIERDELCATSRAVNCQRRTSSASRKARCRRDVNRQRRANRAIRNARCHGKAGAIPVAQTAHAELYATTSGRTVSAAQTAHAQKRVATARRAIHAAQAERAPKRDRESRVCLASASRTSPNAHTPHDRPQTRTMPAAQAFHRAHPRLRGPARPPPDSPIVSAQRLACARAR